MNVNIVYVIAKSHKKSLERYIPNFYNRFFQVENVFKRYSKRKDTKTLYILLILFLKIICNKIMIYKLIISSFKRMYYIS